MPLSTTIYMRANDLPIHTNNNSNNNNTNNNTNSHYNPTPNSNLSTSTDDVFIALNDNTHRATTSPHNHTTHPSPIAHIAVEQHYQRGVELISNPNLWIPERKTDRILKGAITPQGGDTHCECPNIPPSIL
mmetsp:Transcript_32705/g.39151  ORF Transcript_32705/g.39151 Transcript_32705/m.39151 type:complete len:131 (-) Transcript_32705:716-1108(-)